MPFVVVGRRKSTWLCSLTDNHAASSYTAEFTFPLGCSVCTVSVVGPRRELLREEKNSWCAAGVGTV